MITAVSLALAGLTVFAQAVTVLSLLFFLLRKRLPKGFVFGVSQFMGKNRLLFAFLVTFTALSGSLFYSEIARYTPCPLCWWQRIFMYPMPLLLLTALIRDDKSVVPYLKVMSFVGMGISAYHYAIQRLPVNPLIPCGAGGDISCTKQYTMEFGYITIPLMAGTAFLFTIVLLSFKNKVFQEPLIKKTRRPGRKPASKK